jgi:hypothetical protein
MRAIFAIHARNFRNSCAQFLQFLRAQLLRAVFAIPARNFCAQFSQFMRAVFAIPARNFRM